MSKIIIIRKPNNGAGKAILKKLSAGGNIPLLSRNARPRARFTRIMHPQLSKLLQSHSLSMGDSSPSHSAPLYCQPMGLTEPINCWPKGQFVQTVLSNFLALDQ